MALDKTKSIQHAIQDGCQSGNAKNAMVTIYKVAAILVFPKFAVYLKLSYF